MRRSLFALLFPLTVSSAAQAGGWHSVHRYVHSTGGCGDASEVLASHYGIGTHTASGERFDPNGLTAASHDYAMGTSISVTNPKNGRRCTVRINDRGPYGVARQMGVKIDFVLGAARCLGMDSTQYVCVAP
jgi:rare lipoprotein A (peptidoglycan hydrolase)